MALSQKELMLAGVLYRPDDPDLVAERQAAAIWLARYNASSIQPDAAQAAILAERLDHVGEGAVIRPPFHCDYGFNISLGSGVFLNFNCVLLDVVAITIGNGTQIGPGVHIYAADHPRNPAQRAQLLELGRPVHIGRNAWIGGGTIILPGVTIGDNAIVGAGSVVTRDVQPRQTVAGNPARALKSRDR